MIRLILLTAVNLPLIQSYLTGLGVDTKLEVLDLSRADLTDRHQFYYTSRKAFLGKPAKYTIVIRSPFINEQGNEVILEDTKGGYSTSAWNDLNSKGEDRQIHSLVALAHGIGHLAKLPHSKGCVSIMDEDALACANVESLGFLPDELKKINRLS